MRLLRKIERKKWLDRKHHWVPAGEFCADPLGDLRTAQGALSVWCVESDDDAYQVAAAIAAILNFGNVDYLLIDETTLAEQGFKLKSCPGQSAAPSLNMTRHRDITCLTERSLLKLACLFREKGESRTCASTTIMQTLSAGIASKSIDLSQVKPPWLKRMTEEGLLPL